MRAPLLCSLVLVVASCDGSPPGPVPAPLKEPPAARLSALDSETPVARARRGIEQVEGGAGEWKLFSIGADSSVLYGRLVPAPGHAAPEYRLGHLASNGARLSLPDALVTDAIALPSGGVARVSGGRLLIADRAVASDVLPGLAVSPDGRWLAFASGPEPESELFRVSLQGAGAPVALTADGAAATLPHFSPDGASIGYVSNVTGLPSLWIMNADGSGKRQLTNAGLLGDRAEDALRALPAAEGTHAPVWRASTISYFDGARVRAVASDTGASLWQVDGGRAVWGLAGQLVVELSDGSVARVEGAAP